MASARATQVGAEARRGAADLHRRVEKHHRELEAAQLCVQRLRNQRAVAALGAAAALAALAAFAAVAAALVLAAADLAGRLELGPVGGPRAEEHAEDESRQCRVRCEERLVEPERNIHGNTSSWAQAEEAALWGGQALSLRMARGGGWGALLVFSALICASKGIPASYASRMSGKMMHEPSKRLLISSMSSVACDGKRNGRAYPVNMVIEPPTASRTVEPRKTSNSTEPTTWQTQMPMSPRMLSTPAMEPPASGPYLSISAPAGNDTNDSAVLAYVNARLSAVF